MKRYLSLFLLLVIITACAPGTGAPEDPEINTVQLIEDLRVLSSDEMNGRLVGTEGNRLARAYIIRRLQEQGIASFGESYEHTFRAERRNGDEINGVNVLGFIRGASDSLIVLSAHYDHIGHRDTLIFNGADDNASGTAGLLALGNYFQNEQPAHSLLLAFFDAEEGGLNGARALVSDSALVSQVKLNVNMDMIAQNTANELYAVGTYHYPELRSVLFTDAEQESGNSPYEVNLLFGHDEPGTGSQDWTFASDHGPFHGLGIPFIYFGVEDHPHYHQPTDEFETIPQDFYIRSVQSILTAMKRLDSGI